jgi:hypothetical protein
MLSLECEREHGAPSERGVLQMYEVMDLSTGRKYTVDANSETDALGIVWYEVYGNLPVEYDSFESNGREYETATNPNDNRVCLSVRVYPDVREEV